MTETIIQSFVEEYSKTDKLLEEGKLSEAKTQYSELLASYYRVVDSNLESYHKELAYEQLMKVYYLLNQPKKKYPKYANVAAVFILLIAFGTFVAFKPSLIGLAVLDQKFVDPLEVSTSEDYFKAISLKEIPKSFMLSGSFTEGTKAQVFIAEKDSKTLVQVMDTKNLEELYFASYCENSCSVDFKNKNLDLIVEVETGELTLNSLVYTVAKTNSNKPPELSAEMPRFKVKGSSSLSIDFSKYFTDPEGDYLVYLVTWGDGIDVYASGSVVTFYDVGASLGAQNLILFVTDLNSVTRVPFDLEVLP